MRKFFLSAVLLLGVGLSAYALEYNEARKRAWYLTDKMAYELNLSNEQFDLVYEINLDYFLRLNNRYDIEGNSWNYRQTDLQYVLLDWQFSQYCNTEYFYLPVDWRSSEWYYPVQAHYQVDQYYFDRPTTYVSYRGTTMPRGYNDMGRYYGYAVNYTRGMRDHYNVRHATPYDDSRGYALHKPTAVYQTSRANAFAKRESTREVARATQPQRVNATRTQRDIQGNTIPALRSNTQVYTDTQVSRIGRSSSTRVTVNTGRRDRQNNP